MPATYIYLLFNGFVGVAAFYLLTIFPLPAGDEAETGTALQRSVENVLIAGFGGAAFFRSSIARTKVGDLEVSVGPAFVIDAFLGATDRNIDRRRALERTQQIPILMRYIPAGFAADALTQYCIETMQNLSAADEKNLETRAASILKSDLPANVKSMLVGMVITEFTGHKVLEAAIESLHEEVETAREELRRLDEELSISDIEAMLSGAEPANPAPSGAPPGTKVRRRR
ncbi:MAG: hypothetical protein AAFR84_21910 [Pseudomonadota bacterium]